jgi:uncharacterized membrane protein
MNINKNYNIMNIIKLILILLILDFIFIYANINYLTEQMRLVQKSDTKIKPLGVLLTYIFIVLLLFWFIIKDNRSPIDAFILGLCSYGIYEYTNYSTLNEWKFTTTIMDTVWGGTLFALTTYLYQL